MIPVSGFQRDIMVVSENELAEAVSRGLASEARAGFSGSAAVPPNTTTDVASNTENHRIAFKNPQNPVSLELGNYDGHLYNVVHYVI